MINENKELKHQAHDYKILMVCLGNICRSPTAEGVLRHLLKTEAPDLEVRVDSAGTGDWHVGDAPDVRSQRVARARGIELGTLRARQLRDSDFHTFDLMLAMDRENLAVLEARCPPGARARCALFLEYAGVAEARHIAEVPDPYAGDTQDFEQVLELITAGARGLIERLSDRTASSAH